MRLARGHGSVQDLLPLEDIADGVLCLRGGEYRAVIQTQSVNFALKSEEEQEAVMAGYRSFLNSLSHPVQILVRILPTNVEPYLAGFRRIADNRAGEDAIRRLALDHETFVRRLARERTLLERRFYLVVPSGDAPEAIRAAIRWPWKSNDPEQKVPHLATARARLDARCQEIVGPRLLRGDGPEARQRRAHRALGRLSLDPGSWARPPSPLRGAPGGHRLAKRSRPAMTETPLHRRAKSRRRRERSSSADLTFERGTRSAIDHLAPAGIESSRSHLVIDGRYVRVLSLCDYPRYVHPNWLARLIDFDEPLDLSLHIEPLDSAGTIRRLTHKLVELQSSRLLDARSGKIASAEREVAYEDVERLRDALQRGEERVFSVSLYLCLRSGSQQAVEDLNRRVETALGGMMASSRPALFEMLPGFLSCLPAGRDYLGRYRNLDTTSTATMIPFTSSHLSMREGILYGISVHNNSLVIFDPFSRELENANKVVFAKSGAGKSYACKVEALRALMRGVEYYIVDPENEYGRICESVGGQYIRLSGSSSHHINPLDLGPRGSREDGTGDALTERLLALQGLLGLMLSERGSALGQREHGALDRALLDTYRRAGITRDPETHANPAPVLRDLYDVLRAGDDTLGLADRLERFVDGSLGQVFSSPTSVDLQRPFVVFNIRDLEPELRPLGVYLIADHIWREVRASRRPRMLLIDEAWSLMQHEEGARFLSSMARQARKHYLGLTTVTQDVEDFLATPEGHTILANSSVQLLMRQDSSTIDIVSRTFRLSAGEREFLLSCRKGEGLFFASGNHIALRVEASPFEHRLATTDPAELEAAQEEDRDAAG